MRNIRIAAVNICRFILAVTFIFSGYVKAIDPLGTLYKLKDYTAAMSLNDILPDWALVIVAIALGALEFSLGVFMLFAVRRHMVSKLTLALMSVMTALTVWIYIADPVKDCGCFGDALKLTNGETLLKNIVLIACATLVAWRPADMARFISRTNQWIVRYYTITYIIVTSVYCLYTLPIFDFRPYRVGTNIKQGMEIPEGAEQPEFESTFILRKNGVTREFTLDNYPDSTWEYVDTKTVQTKKGYEPPIHDFSITTNDTGEDITEQVLIFTKDEDPELPRNIMARLGRGVTYWEGKGAYTGEDLRVLCVCVSKFEEADLYGVVHELDPNAFFITQEGVTIHGNFIRKLS